MEVYIRKEAVLRRPEHAKKNEADHSACGDSLFLYFMPSGQGTGE